MPCLHLLEQPAEARRHRRAGLSLHASEMAAQQACGCRCVPAVQVLLAERLDSCLAEGIRHVETVRHLVHPRGIAGTSARIELCV
jgi:hypothetical protein